MRETLVKCDKCGQSVTFHGPTPPSFRLFRGEVTGPEGPMEYSFDCDLCVNCIVAAINLLGEERFKTFLSKR